jgi:hypothetical protein
MQIASADIAFTSNHLFARRQTQEETQCSCTRQPRDTQAPALQADISAAARELLAQQVNPVLVAARPAATDAVAPTENSAGGDPMLQLIQSLVEKLTGQAINTFAAAAPNTAAAPTPQAGRGLEYQNRALIEEFEMSTLAAEGVIKTTDGQEVSFRLDIEMVRYSRTETQTSVGAADGLPKAPLVVDFPGPAAQLANRGFRFDVGMNGPAQSPAPLGEGRGFLALLANRNGKIDPSTAATGMLSALLELGMGALYRSAEDRNGLLRGIDIAV